MNVVILAAGNSSRMLSDTHKALHKIGGLELLNHILLNLEQLEFKEAILVCGEEFKFTNKSKLNIKRVIQKDKLGTGDAVIQAKHLLKEEYTLILYVDTPLIKTNSIKLLIELLKKNNNELGLLLFNLSNSNAKYGRAVTKNEIVEEVLEFRDLSIRQKEEFRLANSGIMIAKTNVFQEFLPSIQKRQIPKEKHEYYLTDIVKIAKSAGKSIGFVTIQEDEAIGVNDREGLHDAELIFQEKMRHKFLKNGVTLIDKNTVYFSYDTIIEQDVVVYPNVFFGNCVKIEKSAKILPFCCIENAIIKSGAKIGPFARIRCQTEIGELSEVGNFVEIKNSKLQTNIKAKHLSYIGDSFIGSGSNIGGGTIICNFDGKNKNTTNIGENCFIGANNTIVAPIKIEDNAKTAAGSAITDDIPTNTIAIARTKQINKPLKN